MNLTGKTILVTGGAGFIGSHFVEEAARRNRVIVYDNFSSSVISAASLRAFGNVSVIAGDVLDGKKLARAMKGSDIVFHFAVACVRLSLSQERYVHEVNATGTLTALIAAKHSGVKRFIYISSSEIYGTTDGKTISESQPARPTTVYGMSKYMGELYTKHFHEREGLPGIIVRPFNAYGPRSHFEGVYGEVIPRFTIRALSGKQPTIFGDGTQTRDFTYVTNTVDGIMAASRSDALPGDAVNIAHGREISVSEIARIICEEAGLPFSPVRLPPRPKDVDRLAADTRKARKILGFVPKISVREGIASYVSWVRKSYPDPTALMKLVPYRNW